MKASALIGMVGALLAAPAGAQSTDAAVNALATEAPAPAPATAVPPPVPAAALSSGGKADDGPIGAPPPGKGQVAFFRSGTLMGAAISCAVSENGAKVNSLFRGRYFVTFADPGIHSYSVSSEATDTLRLDVEEGETYYAQCSIGMGFMAGRPNLSPSDKAKFTSMKLKPMERN